MFFFCISYLYLKKRKNSWIICSFKVCVMKLLCLSLLQLHFSQRTVCVASAKAKKEKQTTWWKLNSLTVFTLILFVFVFVFLFVFFVFVFVIKPRRRNRQLGENYTVWPCSLWYFQKGFNKGGTENLERTKLSLVWVTEIFVKTIQCDASMLWCFF